MEINLPVIPQLTALSAEVQTNLSTIETVGAAVEHLVIDSNSMYEVANEERKVIKLRKNKLVKEKESITKPLHAAKSAVIKLFAPAIEYLDLQDRALGKKMLVYTQELERIRREAEAKAQEAARKEQERLRKEAEAEAKKGNAVMAEEKAMQAEMVPTPVIQSQAPKVSGSYQRTTWSATEMPESKNPKMDLIKAVASGKVSEVALNVNMAFLNQQAVKLHEEMDIPGYAAVKSTGLTTRS